MWDFLFKKHRKSITTEINRFNIQATFIDAQLSLDYCYWFVQADTNSFNIYRKYSVFFFVGFKKQTAKMNLIDQDTVAHS